LDDRYSFELHTASSDADATEAVAQYSGLLGKSLAMQTVFRRIEQVAPTNSTVLITGESGTGKELVARAIHGRSRRNDGPFITLNCSAMPRELVEDQLFGHEKGAFTSADATRQGMFEAANDGTLFLDEIGDLAPEAQAKLLRSLEYRQITRVGSTHPITVDIRLVAATNTDLESAVTTREFREDLYYRLKVFTITMPPLRNRSADVPLLVRHFLNEFARENGSPAKEISQEALSVLQSYAWPGNVRELKNLMESLAIRANGSSIVALEDLPAGIRLGSSSSGEFSIPVGLSLKQIRCAAIQRTLEHTEGNRTEAAKILKIGRRTLQRNMKECGLV
jgi:two-component system response regulator HydG